MGCCAALLLHTTSTTREGKQLIEQDEQQYTTRAKQWARPLRVRLGEDVRDGREHDALETIIVGSWRRTVEAVFRTVALCSSSLVPPYHTVPSPLSFPTPHQTSPPAFCTAAVTHLHPSSAPTVPLLPQLKNKGTGSSTREDTRIARPLEILKQIEHGRRLEVRWRVRQGDAVASVLHAIPSTSTTSPHSPALLCTAAPRTAASPLARPLRVRLGEDVRDGREHDALETIIVGSWRRTVEAAFRSSTPYHTVPPPLSFPRPHQTSPSAFCPAAAAHLRPSLCPNTTAAARTREQADRQLDEGGYENSETSRNFKTNRAREKGGGAACTPGRRCCVGHPHHHIHIHVHNTTSISSSAPYRRATHRRITVGPPETPELLKTLLVATSGNEKAQEGASSAPSATANVARGRAEPSN
ncbi:hypothetical protein K438DRAFT_1971934 [Mycena galopus ATCC 62051]|nr:hypothetical protein K438DRAFT_1971934 [Mycena galopus ATCC 62051]